MQQTNFIDAPEYSPPANPFADSRPMVACDNCTSTRFNDRPIHGGRDTIRECAYCRRFMGFPTWNGQRSPAQQVASSLVAGASHGPNGPLP